MVLSIIEDAGDTVIEVLIEGFNLGGGGVEDGEVVLEESVLGGLVALDVEGLVGELGVEGEHEGTSPIGLLDLDLVVEPWMDEGSHLSDLRLIDEPSKLNLLWVDAIVEELDWLEGLLIRSGGALISALQWNHVAWCDVSIVGVQNTIEHSNDCLLGLIPHVQVQNVENDTRVHLEADGCQLVQL
jgi:hypothetical protein